MNNTTPTWTDAHGHEHQLCAFCNVDCSTHPDAGNPLSCCGDCGRATCPDHRVEDAASRCVDCAATFYALPAADGVTPRTRYRYQTCAHSHCTQPARIGFTTCAGHAPTPTTRHLALAQAWCRYNGQRGTAKQTQRVMRQLSVVDLIRMLWVERGVPLPGEALEAEVTQ